MPQVTPTYNFTAAKEGAYTVFNYKKTPISYKLALPLCFYTAIPALLLTMFIKPSSTTSGVMIWLVVMIGLGLGITALINALRKPGEFRVNAKEVITGDKQYTQDHIAGYFVKDPQGNASAMTFVTVTNHNPLSLGSNLGAMQASVGKMGNESRMAIRKHIADAGYKICIRFGTKDIVIAKGLGQREADMMLIKIKEASQV